MLSPISVHAHACNGLIQGKFGEDIYLNAQIVNKSRFVITLFKLTEHLLKGGLHCGTPIEAHYVD